MLEKIMSHIEEVLLFCSGVEKSLLPEMLRKKYTGLGGLVIFTTLVAFCSGTYALTFVFRVQALGGLGGLAWAGFIFSLDRVFLTVRKNKDESILRKLLRATPRLFFGSLVAMVVSIPAETFMFSDSVRLHHIERLETENKRLEQQVNAWWPKKYTRDLVTGKTIDNKPVLDKIQSWQKQIDGNNQRIARFETGALDLVEMAFVEQVETIWTQALSSPVKLALHLFVILFFWGMEVTPILIKILAMDYDAYDNVYALEEDAKKKLDDHRMCLETELRQFTDTVRYSDFQTAVTLASENAMPGKIQRAEEAEKEQFEQDLQRFLIERYPSLRQYYQESLEKMMRQKWQQRIAKDDDTTPMPNNGKSAEQTPSTWNGNEKDLNDPWN